MKVLLTALVVSSVTFVGCARWRHASARPAANVSQSTPPAPQTNSTEAPRPIVTPETGSSGKVVAFNSVGRFVVVNFPIAHMPAMEQRLFVYRRGLKVGEMKVTGPQREDNIVGDLLSGEALPGDEIRDQ